jgi:hypothetical protein
LLIANIFPKTLTHFKHCLQLSSYELEGVYQRAKFANHIQDIVCSMLVQWNRCIFPIKERHHSI